MRNKIFLIVLAIVAIVFSPRHISAEKCLQNTSAFYRYDECIEIEGAELILRMTQFQDGSDRLIIEYLSESGRDILVWDDGAIITVADTDALEQNAAVSQDGMWIVYQYSPVSDESEQSVSELRAFDLFQEKTLLLDTEPNPQQPTFGPNHWVIYSAVDVENVEQNYQIFMTNVFPMETVQISWGADAHTSPVADWTKEWISWRNLDGELIIYNLVSASRWTVNEAYEEGIFINWPRLNCGILFGVDRCTWE